MDCRLPVGRWRVGRFRSLRSLRFPVASSRCGASEFPILPFEQRVCVGKVRDAHLLRVPLQALAGKLTGDDTKAERLGQRPRVIESGQRLVLAFDRIQKLGVMIDAMDVWRGEILSTDSG